MPSWSGDLQAQINSVRNYQHDTFSFLKYCETYIVGYSTRGVQIIQGKCHYGGIRDIGADIGGHYPGDLPAFIRGLVYADLPAEIIGEEDTQEEDLGGIIGGHYPKDLQGIIAAHQPEDLPGYIRGFDYRDLPASITILFSKLLPAEIAAHQPEDLSAYIKPWPQRDLGGDIHGWDTKDLQGIINIIAAIDLPATIYTHSPKNLRGIIKGWVREATYDLGAIIGGLDADDLPAEIRGTEMRQLPAYIFSIAPKDLSANIYGWDTKDLQGIINGVYNPWDLQASINGSPWRSRDLSATITSSVYPFKDLTGIILGTRGQENLTAQLGIIYKGDLGAYIDTGRDINNLPASIYPKMMRLTGIISVVTMEHSDLSATINIPCFYSDFRDLATYINPVFKSDLGAFIHPQSWGGGIENLGAKWGYHDRSVVQDKLSITLTFTGWDYRTEDKITIITEVFRSGLSLGASIVAQRLPGNLSASITGVRLKPYEFDNWKLRERAQSRNYTQVATEYEDVDVSFKTIVRDYFYSSGSNVVAKVNRYEHFVTKVASYYSPAKARRLNRTLHKVKLLYDMRQFDNIDEAIRFAILLVTETPKIDLNAMITATGEFNNLTSSIIGKDKISTDTDLSSYIEGQRDHSYDVVVAFTDDGIGYLQF